MTVRIHPVGDPETPKTWAWPKYAQRGGEERCICPFVDVGVGVMQHGVDPDCPVCNPELHLECSCADWPGVVEFESWLHLPRLYGSWPYSLSPDRHFVIPRHGSEIDPCCPIHGE
jgi:hypothetical protein